MPVFLILLVISLILIGSNDDLNKDFLDYYQRSEYWLLNSQNDNGFLASVVICQDKYIRYEDTIA